MLKPVDLTVLAWLTTADLPAGWTQVQVAQGLGISQSNVHRALVELRRSSLMVNGSPRRAALHELIVHAVRYVYPATLGPPTRGLGTSHAGPGIAGALRSEWPYVWPFDDGRDFGPSIEPLHPCVPRAATQSPRFHELMALIDTMRVGRARERELAIARLDTLLGTER